MLDPYAAKRRLPESVVGSLHAMTYPGVTGALAVSVYAIASHSLRTRPRAILYVALLGHHGLSVGLAVAEAAYSDSRSALSMMLLQLLTGAWEEMTPLERG